ncbi:hypothetical protein WMZ97_03795 [Lentibacillus sp. N15]|uniref:hypothetical protein n=1 Tax=Lentibacillus songyuanensis TaxID=3136161 RepID=UPI0031BA1A74
MSKSNARKRREKSVREGRLNPEMYRSPFAQLDLHTRKTKTKKDYLYRTKHKNRHPHRQDNDSFYFFMIHPWNKYLSLIVQVNHEAHSPYLNRNY